jgi:hypothetical protein
MHLCMDCTYDTMPLCGPVLGIRVWYDIAIPTLGRTHYYTGSDECGVDGGGWSGGPLNPRFDSAVTEIKLYRISRMESAGLETLLLPSFCVASSFETKAD